MVHSDRSTIIIKSVHRFPRCNVSIKLKTKKLYSLSFPYYIKFIFFLNNNLQSDHIRIFLFPVSIASVIAMKIIFWYCQYHEEKTVSDKKSCFRPSWLLMPSWCASPSQSHSFSLPLSLSLFLQLNKHHLRPLGVYLSI